MSNYRRVYVHRSESSWVICVESIEDTLFVM